MRAACLEAHKIGGLRALAGSKKPPIPGIEEKMNGFELRENWRDESGCNSVTTGRNKTKITDMSCTNYVVFIVERLIDIDNHLLIMDTKIRSNMQQKSKI